MLTQGLEQDKFVVCRYSCFFSMLIIVGKLASCVAFNPEYNIYCYDHALFYNSSIIIMLHNIIVVHPSGFISGGLLHPPPWN